MSAKRILKRLSRNLGFKILALILAVIIWLVIVNIEDPEKSRVITVPVTVENESYLTDQGMRYEIVGNSNISFTVSGARTIVEDLSESDFKATADLEEINDAMTRVPIRINVARFNSGLELQKRTQYLNIEVEKIIEKDLEIQIDMQGKAPSNRHVTVASVKPEKVSVSGPETVMKQVKEARVSVDISSGNEDFSGNGEIILYDKEGKTVDTTELTLGDSQVTVQFHVDARKEIPLTVRTAGTPAEGYQVTGITCSPEKVTVTGEDTLLNDLTELELTSEELDVSEREEGFEASVPIGSQLPEGIILADGAPTKATVSVAIEPYITKTLTINTSQIKKKGLANGYSLRFDEETIELTLRGREEDLADVDASDITGTIDVSGLGAGGQSVALKLDSPYVLDKTVTVPVTITGS